MSKKIDATKEARAARLGQKTKKYFAAEEKGEGTDAGAGERYSGNSRKIRSGLRGRSTSSPGNKIGAICRTVSMYSRRTS